MRFIAQELREYMAQLGFKTVDEMVGRSDLLEPKDDVENIDKIIDNFPDYPHEYDNKEFVKAIDKMISQIVV